MAAAGRSVERDSDRLADELEERCTRVQTCLKVRYDELVDALSMPLAAGNEVTFYRGRQFHVVLCVANDEHEVWAHYHSEHGTETYRGGEPCDFS